MLVIDNSEYVPSKLNDTAANVGGLVRLASIVTENQIELKDTEPYLTWAKMHESS